MSRVIRTASFSRRSSRNSGASNREGTTSEESNSSSPRTDSRCASPASPESNAPLSDKLEGWLLKRHTSEKTIGAQWARRYLHVNELRGTLSMSKGPTKTASAVLSLNEIKSVMVSERSNETGPNCFVIRARRQDLDRAGRQPRGVPHVGPPAPPARGRVARQVQPGGERSWPALRSCRARARARARAFRAKGTWSDRAPPSGQRVLWRRQPHDAAPPTAARSPNKGAGRNESLTQPWPRGSQRGEPRPARPQGVTGALRPPPLPGPT